MCFRKTFLQIFPLYCTVLCHVVLCYTTLHYTNITMLCKYIQCLTHKRKFSKKCFRKTFLKNISSTTMLCYAILHCTVLYYTVLTLLCHANTYKAVLCYAMPCCVILWHTVPCYSALCCTVPYHATARRPDRATGRPGRTKAMAKDLGLGRGAQSPGMTLTGDLRLGRGARSPGMTLTLAPG